MANLIYNSFREWMADGTIDLDGDTFKVALLTTSYTPAATHLGYASLTNEVASGNGYTTGGNALDSVTWTKATTTVTLDAANEAWTSATFTAAYAAIYDDTVTTPTADPLVCLFDFGGSKTVSAGTFTLQFDASNGILKLS